MAQKFFPTSDQIISIQTYMDDIKRSLYIKNGSEIDPIKLLKILEQISDPSRLERGIVIDELYKVAFGLS